MKKLNSFIFFVLIFAGFTLNASEFGSLNVFPNPVQSTRGHATLTLDNLPRNREVKIFNLRGRKVFEERVVNGGTQLVWDLKNSDGKIVSSGIYIYVLESLSTGEKLKGKFAIIR